MSWHRVVAPAFLAGLVACGSTPVEAPEPVPEEERILTGTFRGTFRSQDQGIVLDGHLTLDLTELSTGELIGEFSLEGTLDDGEVQQPIAGSGPLVGAVAPDDVAQLSFTAEPDFCPGHTIDFSGTFHRLLAGLRVNGPIVIFDSSCAVVLTFPSSIPMRR